MSVWVLPPPGKMPTATSGRPNTAARDATMRSHARASSKPPASAYPSTAAIAGTGSACTRVMSRTTLGALGAEPVVVERGPLLEVHARRERAAAGARDDDRPDRERIARDLGLDRVERAMERREQRVVDGVQRGGPVEREDDDLVALAGAGRAKHRLGGHVMRARCHSPVPARRARRGARRPS